MKKYDFILIYEHKVRELESLCLLKSELEHRGYSVLIKCYHDKDIFETQNRVCVPKYHAKVLGVFACYDTYTLRICVQNCIAFDKVIDMQWEQMISRKQEQQGSYRNFKEIGKEVVHISWGDANVERLARVADIADKKVIKCGNIANDLLREDFRGYYFSQERIKEIYGFDKNAKICVIFANFRGAEYTEEQVEILRKKFGNERVEIQKLGKKTQREVTQWVKKAALELPDYEFIYRPHPGENPIYVKEIIEGVPNIHIIGDYSSRQWIFVSDYMFSWHSTVLIEAYLAGKDCYSLEPYPYIEAEDSNVFKGMHAIKDYDTFKSVLLGEGFNSNLSKNEIEKYFGESTAEYNYKKVANAYINVYKDSYYMLDKVILKYKVYKERYSNLKERIWGNPIINFIFWRYIELGSKFSWFRKINSSAYHFDRTNKTRKVELVSEKEIEDMQKKLESMLNVS